MIHGYEVAHSLCGGLQDFMSKHGFKSISEFKGHALPYVTTHSDLVVKQRAAIEAKKGRVGIANDAEWSGDKFVEQSNNMVA